MTSPTTSGPRYRSPKSLPDLHVLDVAGVRAPDASRRRSGRRRPGSSSSVYTCCCARRLEGVALGRGVAFGVHEVGVPDGDELAALVPVHPPAHGDGRAATEAGLLLGGDVDVEPAHPDAVALVDGVEVPGVVAGPEHVHPGQGALAPALAARARRAARGVRPAPSRKPGGAMIPPHRDDAAWSGSHVQGVVVAEAVGVVADPVAGRLLVPGRPPGVGPVDAHLLPEAFDALVGELSGGRGVRGLGNGHGSS